MAVFIFIKTLVSLLRYIFSLLYLPECCKDMTSPSTNTKKTGNAEQK